MFYYEVEIIQPALGIDPTMCIGLSLLGSPPKEKQMLGFKIGWGYSSGDGKRYFGKGQVDCGPVYLFLNNI